MTSPTEAALREALDDEYKARATYRAVIAAFGPVRPFVNIVEAEQRHIDALLALFAARGWTAPSDIWADRVETPENIEAACRDGVEAEIENGEMYDRLLAAAADDPEVIRVFRRLQAASQDNHLPAFRRCVEKASDDGRGMGGGRGSGAGPGSGAGRGRRHRGGRGA